MPQIPNQSSRTATVGPVDTDTRTVELSFSSETPYERAFGDEVLSHAPGAMRDGRLRNSAPLLVGHSFDDQIGVVESVEIAGGRGRARVRFSRSARAQEMFDDVKDGIRRNVSVGYAIYATRTTPRAGQRDLVTVTDWEPLEISIVAVPADPTVGVGRSQSGETMPNLNPIARAEARKRGRKPAKSKTQRATVPGPDIQSHRGLVELAMGRGSSEVDQLAELIERGRHATAKSGRHRADGTFVADRRLSTTAAISGSLSVSDSLRPLFGTAGTNATSSTMQAGAQTTLSSALLSTSRVMQAGVQLVPIPESVVHDTGIGVPAFTETASGYELVEAANFQTGAPDENDEVELSEQSLQLKRATAERDSLSMWGVRVKLPRSAMRERGARQVAAELFTSIALGVARVADREVLAALVPQIGKSFSLSNAAAYQLDFPALAGLIGTSAAGATTTDAGKLMVAADGVKIPAMLTPDMSETVVGEWPRVALALGGDIRMMLQRTNAAGSLIATAWIDVQALTPDTDRFWTVEAAE